MKKIKNLSMFKKIALGFVLGILIGLVMGERAGMFEFLGLIMIRLFTMVVVPLVLCMMVVSIGDIGTKILGKMGLLTTGIFILSTPFAIINGLFFAHIFNVGAGVPATAGLEAVNVAETPTFVQSIVNIIPNNVFTALTNADLMQIMAFAILAGIGISAMPNRENAAFLLRFFKSFGELMQKILDYAMEFTPIGVFGVTAWLIGVHGFASLLPFATFGAAVYAAAFSYMLIFQIGIMGRLLGKTKIGDFISATREALLFCFATNSSFASLPMAFTAVKRLGIRDKISNFVVPYGIVVNMDGTASYLAVAVMFIARVYGIELGMTDMAMIIATATIGSIGASGVPGAAIVMLNSVLLVLGLPVEAVAMLIGFHRLIGPTTSLLNLNGDFAACAIVNRFMKEEELEGYSTGAREEATA